MPHLTPGLRQLAALAGTCLLSIALYVLLCAFILDRPLTLGALRGRLEATLARGSALAEPKLVILAGSNAPYSHRCEVIEHLLDRPCVNGGIAVGVGLDYLFARWKPLLRAGDIVYLPLEEAQYSRPRAMAELGPDAIVMLRHDRATLMRMSWHRQISALFSSGLRDMVMSVIELGLVKDGFPDPRAAVAGTYNAWGDHVGHTAALGRPNQAALQRVTPWRPTAEQIRSGYGTQVVGTFLDWCAAHGVRAIGGLPTGFADSPVDADDIAAIFRAHGAAFLRLNNLSRYRREDFFDSADHLNQEAQIRHSVLVGRALAAMTESVRLVTER